MSGTTREVGTMGTQHHQCCDGNIIVSGTTREVSMMGTVADIAILPVHSYVGNDQRSQYDGNPRAPVCTWIHRIRVGNDQRSQYDGNH